MSRFQKKLAEFKEYLRTHDGGYPMQSGPYIHPLGLWVRNIRAAMKNTGDKKEGVYVLSAEQIDSLNAIDFVWSGSYSNQKRSARFYEIVRNEKAEASRSDAELNEAPLLKIIIEKFDGMMLAMARVEEKLANLEAQGHADRVIGEWSEEMPLLLTDNMEEV
jgi:hypothetical protein